MRSASYATSFILLLATLLTAHVAPTVSTDGEWGPIPGVNDCGILFVANWAVQEHNRLSGETLTFDKVLNCSELSEGPIFTFRLLISALNANGQSGSYDVEVLNGPWTNTRVLNYFAPAS
ncbi:cysteine proteinase inhibitor 8 [Brachypodium distachyon]|uniref:Cystatin domain-containing protein n=1 Tax=Brachypodium distachyon TaxID=15368 RepID=A0A0Q3L8I6_BRADI|nr:cysteine proteinase inhibitor 8 [Brachypodium distachyon]KQK19449.1 hypothetical protein BRADI_1g48316v3 [Brachypodium distachyon]|eukprot:XP_010229933.1 cysteine proteinase inhibitor 8 [Brachypodium distachyon]